MDCVADDLWLFGIGDGEGWKTVASDSGKWCEGVIMEAIWRKEEGRAAEVRQQERGRRSGLDPPPCAGCNSGTTEAL